MKPLADIGRILKGYFRPRAAPAAPPAAPKAAAEPPPLGLWPKWKYQQDARNFEELADSIDRQAKVRQMEIAAGDSLTPHEQAQQALARAVNRAASGTAPADGKLSPRKPTVLEVDVEVLRADLPAARSSQPQTSLSSPAPSLSPSIRPSSALAPPVERGIDQILHELLHEKKWLTPAERQKLDRAYQMEKYRAGLHQGSDPSTAMVFRKFVPPQRPPAFHQMSATNRMWYCRMEELWTFRQEDAAKAQLASPAPSGTPGKLPAPAAKALPPPRQNKRGRRAKS